MTTAVLITARLKSTRLPRKVLKPIQGRPMLAHLVDRMKRVQQAQQVILITSTVAQDDPLEAFAKDEGIACFRGHPDDVLVRMRDAAEHFGVDTVVSCTADNPFVDPESIDNLLEFHTQNHHDFTNTEGLPWGAFAYALQTEAICRACDLKDEVDTEVWGGYFTQTGRFSCGTLSITDPTIRWPELRLTVDTPEDFALAEAVFSRLYQPGQVFDLRQVVALCRQYPELPAINATVQQKAGAPIRLKKGGPRGA